MGETRNAYKVFVGRHEGKRPLGRQTGVNERKTLERILGK
jgi:hypothetical protein